MKKMNLPMFHQGLTYVAVTAILIAGLLTLLGALFGASGASWIGLASKLINLATTVAVASAVSSLVISFYRSANR